MLEEFNARMFTSPWTRVARREFTGALELRALFESESLPAPLEAFFDQRFIDFPGSNFSDIENQLASI